MPKKNEGSGGGTIISLIIFFILISNEFGGYSFGSQSYGEKGFGLLVIIGFSYLLVKISKEKKNFGMVLFYVIIYAIILMIMIAIV